MGSCGGFRWGLPNPRTRQGSCATSLSTNIFDSRRIDRPQHASSYGPRPTADRARLYLYRRMDQCNPWGRRGVGLGIEIDRPPLQSTLRRFDASKADGGSGADGAPVPRARWRYFCRCPRRSRVDGRRRCAARARTSRMRQLFGNPISQFL